MFSLIIFAMFCYRLFLVGALCIFFFYVELKINDVYINMDKMIIIPNNEYACADI